MAELKFKLTTESKINDWGVKLFRIEATVDFKDGYNEIKKGAKGGWVESEKVNGNARISGDAWVYGNAEVFGNARVYGNAEVYGDAWVFGNARVSLKKAYTKGRFLSSSDSTITPVVIDQSEEDGFDGSKDYKNLLVVGDYEINDIETGTASQLKTINIGGKEYEVTDELTRALENLKETKNDQL